MSTSESSVIAGIDYGRLPRGRHGILLSDATNPKLEGRWVAEPTTDFAQKTLNAEIDEWRKKYGDVLDMDAVLWQVKKKND